MLQLPVRTNQYKFRYSVHQSLFLQKHPASSVSPEQCLVQQLVCGVKLHWHAQSTVQHIIVAVLCAKRLVGDLEAGRAVYRSIDPRHLTS